MANGGRLRKAEPFRQPARVSEVGMSFEDERVMVDDLEDDEGPELRTLLRDLVRAVGRIAEGDSHSMSGIEGLAFALAGDGLTAPIGQALLDAAEMIGEGLHDLADAVREFAPHAPADLMEPRPEQNQLDLAGPANE